MRISGNREYIAMNSWPQNAVYITNRRCSIPTWVEPSNTAAVASHIASLPQYLSRLFYSETRGTRGLGLDSIHLRNYPSPPTRRRRDRKEKKIPLFLWMICVTIVPKRHTPHIKANDVTSRHIRRTVYYTWYSAVLVCCLVVHVIFVCLAAIQYLPDAGTRSAA